MRPKMGSKIGTKKWEGQRLGPKDRDHKMGPKDETKDEAGDETKDEIRDETGNTAEELSRRETKS